MAAANVEPSTEAPGAPSSLLETLEKLPWGDTVQGYLAHKKTPNPPRLP